jgi:hypothetical protein
MFRDADYIKRIRGVQHPAKPVQAHHGHSLCKDNR